MANDIGCNFETCLLKAAIVVDILIVDDDSDDLFFFTTVFKELNQDLLLQSFQNPLELVEILKIVGSTKVVILDFKFPLTTGLEMVKIIRGEALSQQPKILIWSASATNEDAAACLEAGADWFISKPVKYADIRSKVNRILEMWLS